MPYTNGCCRTQHTATTTHSLCTMWSSGGGGGGGGGECTVQFCTTTKNNRQMARLGFKREIDRAERESNQTKSALINSQFVTCVQTTHWLPKKEHTHKTLAVIDANRGAAAAGYWLATLYPTKSTDTETQTLEMGSSDEEGKKEEKRNKTRKEKQRRRKKSVVVVVVVVVVKTSAKVSRW